MNEDALSLTSKERAEAAEAPPSPPEVWLWLCVCVWAKQISYTHAHTTTTTQTHTDAEGNVWQRQIDRNSGLMYWKTILRDNGLVQYKAELNQEAVLKRPSRASMNEDPQAGMKASNIGFSVPMGMNHSAHAGVTLSIILELVVGTRCGIVYVNRLECNRNSATPTPYIQILMHPTESKVGKSKSIHRLPSVTSFVLSTKQRSRTVTK